MMERETDRDSLHSRFMLGSLHIKQQLPESKNSRWRMLPSRNAFTNLRAVALIQTKNGNFSRNWHSVKQRFGQPARPCNNCKRSWMMVQVTLVHVVCNWSANSGMLTVRWVKRKRHVELKA